MATNGKKLSIYLIAGEASGDLLGARLITALKKQVGKNLVVQGVGGEAMLAQGMPSLFNIADLSVMGLAEVIPSIPKILGRINQVVDDIVAKKPDIVMTIDSYSFAVRVHKKLKKLGLDIPQVHCVAPQVWAWKQGRAKTFGNYVDHLFCLLPYEADYFTPHGLDTTFIGHPVIESDAMYGDGDYFRGQYGIDKSATVMSILPGSRKNELHYLMPTFMQVAEKIKQQDPSLFVVFPTVETVSTRLEKVLENWDVPHVIVKGEKNRYDAFKASNVAMAASGTVSLELALAGVPHVVGYKVSPITGAIVKRLLKIKFVNLINILSQKEVIPELLQDNFTVDNVLSVVQQLLEQPQQDTALGLEKLGLGVLQPSSLMAQVLQDMAKKPDMSNVISFDEAVKKRKAKK